jgi:hypothetical protein
MFSSRASFDGQAPSRARRKRSANSHRNNQRLRLCEPHLHVRPFSEVNALDKPHLPGHQR